MALFKIFGNFASGNTTLPEATNQGYCYFDKNTGKFYIDTATSSTATLGTNRLALNADKADKDSSGNNIVDTYLTKSLGITDVSLNTATRKLQKTINGTTSDITALAIIPGAGENSGIGGGVGDDYVSTATGTGALAFGRQSSAIGNYSFAFGRSSEARGLYSVAMGGRVETIPTIAVGAGSVAIGGGAQTGDVNATSTDGKGNYAVAMGYLSKAIGNVSTAFGYGTIANGAKSTAIGAYNISDTEEKYAFIIGDGTADNARSNALTVDWNGNTAIAGSLMVGAASYGDTLPATGTTGQIFFVTDNEEGETVTATDISNWNNKSTVSITRNLTSGTKVGTITIDGTSTDLYCQTNTDTKTRQTLYSSNYNLPLLMSYQTITNTTTNIDNVTYRNNSIYANPSSGTIFTPNLQITTTLKAPTTSGGTTYDIGSDGQVLTSNGTSVYWGNVSTTLKFENITVQSTSWVTDTTYADFGYKASITCNGVTSNHIPTVIFDYTELTSGNYCPYADSGTDTVYIYSKVQDTITIPTIYCV